MGVAVKKVYQARRPNFLVGPPLTFPDDFELVAEVDAELAEVFRLTNTIDRPWFESADSRLMVRKAPCRSTSMGDVVVDAHGNVHLCVKVGWKRIGQLSQVPLQVQ
jgi:hypothetical protein